MIVVLNKNILLKSLIIIQVFLCAGKLLAQPVANFSATPLTGCAPLAVQFTDLSTGNPTKWKWDLGNGSTPNIQNPQTTYFTPGLYKITLTATNAAGSNTIVKDQYINVQFNPTAKFIGNPTTGCLPLPVQFTDQSIATNGSISSWKWDFGDGFIDSVQNPKHVYTTNGIFDVTLLVKNSVGCPGAVSQTRYTNTSNSVTADFTNNIQNSCKPPVNLNFQNLSTGPSLTYKWDFGDGSPTSGAKNPAHSFSTAGNFTVQLITTSAGGCTDTVKKTIAIGTVTADFVAPLSVCPGKSFSLTNTSLPSPLGAAWDFGDGTRSDSLNPIKVYSNPGNYTIKMVADFGACKDSVSKPITVIAKQKLAFTVDDSASCKAPFTLNFTSNVAGATSYFWNFGDGTPTSTLQNPMHTYNTTGSFNITFITTNSFGCRDTLVKLRYIKVQPAGVTLPGLPQKNCAPFTYTFAPSINSVDSVTGYSWNFGDGATSTNANPSHTFSAVGSYNISLTITTVSGCTVTTQVLNGVIVGNKPAANFTGSPRVACASEPINFTDLSAGVITEWLWDFGDSTFSSLQNPSHNYNDTGRFKVKLLVRSNGCPDSISFSNYIRIKPATSKFYIKANCAFPLQKGFVDSSKGADTWEWDFGDGSPKSPLKNPKHTYADTGTYTVSLKVTNLTTGCEHTSTKKALVIIENAMFTADATNICKNSFAVLRQQGINSSHLLSYNWQFGDGSPGQSNVDSISHKYVNSGVYTTRLIITDLLGCRDTLTRPKYITVAGPTAKYTSNVPGTCVNNSIDFIDGSVSDGTHPIVQWIWDYGDNTTDILSGPPFRHTYTKTGIFTVKLKVRDSNGCEDSLVKVNNLTISKPVANFTTKDSASCPGAPVQFTNLSNSPNLVYLWNFGDATTSNQPNPVHSYTTNGTFTVSLKISDQFGCSDSLTKTNYITITSPVANFSLSDSVSACPPFFVSFTSSSANYTKLSWDFGDGGGTSPLPMPTHYYFIPGNYIVRLRATGPGGCFDEKTTTIIVKGPKGVLSYTNLVGCNTLKTDFKATAKDNLLFTWDFNDGVIVKTSDSSISHVYTDTGFYLPKLILEDASGCQVPILGTDTIKVITIKAEFNAFQRLLCDQGLITFSDSSLSNDRVVNWKWDFGNGFTSTQQNPVNNYASPGLYNVSLIAATSFGCADTVSKNSYIQIIARPDIDITGPSAICELDTINFKGIFLKPDTSAVTWKWDFGNGQTSLLQVPQSQKYSAAGNFVINAIATNSSGCMDTASHALTVNPLPAINAGSDAFLCLGTPVQLQASGAVSYQWSPANFLTCTNCFNPITSTPDNITYVVKGTTSLGCIASDSVTIRVKKPFSITLTPNADSICTGESVRLNASYAENYLWTPIGGLTNTTIQNPIASPGVNTTYKVVGYDSAGCYKDSALVNVSVFKYPAVDAGANKTIKLGESITLSPVYSDDVVKWLWISGSGLSCTACANPLATPTANTTYTIKVENNGGCSATDKVTIFIVCNNENFFIPNTFSPNGDGVNDVFYPRGIGLNRIRGLKIFNRWGQVVFEKSNFYANDPASGWDGLVGGKKVPADVYTFVIDIICDNGDLISQSGNVALLK